MEKSKVGLDVLIKAKSNDGAMFLKKNVNTNIDKIGIMLVQSGVLKLFFSSLVWPMYTHWLGVAAS